MAIKAESPELADFEFPIDMLLHPALCQRIELCLRPASLYVVADPVFPAPHIGSTRMREKTIPPWMPERLFWKIEVGPGLACPRINAQDFSNEHVEILLSPF